MGTKVMLALLGLAAVALGQTPQLLDPGGIQPVYLLVTDLNSDGFPDLVVACHSSNLVAVFENTRKPCASFASPVFWRLGDAPVALAAGHFMDPVCLPSSSCLPYTSVLPNIVAVTQYEPGLVRFSPVEAKEPFLRLVSGGPVEVSALPFTTLTHLVVADFNKDGASDVVVLDGISMKIGVYLGDRSTLTPAVPAQGSAKGEPNLLLNLEGERAYFLGAADFDRDGQLDLVVSVDGNLLFFPALQAPPVKVKLGLKLVSFTLADFNRDGYVDVAVVDPEFGALTILLNRGCWKFERGPRLKFDGYPVYVLAADFDRNGLTDLVVAEREANQISLVINELMELGAIERPDPSAYTVTPPEKVDSTGFKVVRVVEVGQKPVALVADDFDRNGMMDLAVALFGENKVQIIYNLSLSKDCAGKVPCTAAPPSPRQEEKPQKEEEKKPEEGEAPAGSGPSGEGPSAWSLEVAQELVLSLPRPDLDLLALGDLNKDGIMDLVLGSTKHDTLLVFEGTGGGNFVAKGDVRITGFIPEKLLLADLDGNGLADVVAISLRNREAMVLWSKGSFLFEPVTFFGLPTKVKDVLALRLTDSSREELVLLTEDTPLVWSIPQRGGIVEWSKPPSVLAGFKASISDPTSYAVLTQGQIVTIHYSNNPGEISFIVNGSSLASVHVAHEGPILAIGAADIDGDGFPDVVGLEDGGKVRIWLLKKG